MTAHIMTAIGGKAFQQARRDPRADRFCRCIRFDFHQALFFSGRAFAIPVPEPKS